jgi:hypothetical protein
VSATTVKGSTNTAITTATTCPLEPDSPNDVKSDGTAIEKRAGEEYWFRYENPDVVNAGNNILPLPSRPSGKVRYVLMTPALVRGGNSAHDIFFSTKTKSFK